MTVSTLHSAAIISDCGRYRYQLSRWWDATESFCAFVMLNPSTADATSDDPTIRRCMSFARQWGFGGIEVVNLFAYRATSPADLLAAQKAGVDIVGPENHDRIVRVLEAIGEEVVAWGANVDRLGGIPDEFPDDGYPVMCLGTTKDGHPRHPLYVKGDTLLTEWIPKRQTAPPGTRIA